MEEDIKILEDVLKDKDTKLWIGEQGIQTIENLIARYKELETIVKIYNAIPNDYMPNDVKIVIADREYFNNGIFKENLIPKSKVKDEISYLMQKYDLEEDYINYETVIEILQELLED